MISEWWRACILWAVDFGWLYCMLAGSSNVHYCILWSEEEFLYVAVVIAACLYRFVIYTHQEVRTGCKVLRFFQFFTSLKVHKISQVLEIYWICPAYLVQLQFCSLTSFSNQQTVQQVSRRHMANLSVFRFSVVMQIVYLWNLHVTVRLSQ